MKSKILSWGLFVFILIAVLLYISPFYISFISAFKPNGEIMRDPVALPESFFYLENFKFLLAKTDFPKAFLNSALLTIAAELCILFIIPMAAYGIERTNKRVGSWIYTYFLAAMMVPFTVYMIPLFRQLKFIGLFGTFYGPILIYVSGAIPFGVLLFTSFLKGVPREIEEAAKIDGCNSFKTFWQIVFPLLKPVTASMVILNGLGIWNDFLMPMLVLPSSKPKTINVEIYQFVDQFGARWDILFAGVLCSIIPVFIVFVSLQKYFVKGISAGAAKG
ncbi:carbohydrate ABC transporter permease [Vallitaleaceae bacterium 9-2]